MSASSSSATVTCRSTGVSHVPSPASLSRCFRPACNPSETRLDAQAVLARMRTNNIPCAARNTPTSLLLAIVKRDSQHTGASLRTSRTVVGSAQGQLVKARFSALPLILIVPDAGARTRPYGRRRRAALARAWAS